MTTIREWLAASPAVARCLPFGVFALLTLFQGELGPASRFWIYLLKTVLGVALVWVTWPIVKEMRWRFSWQAVAVGLAVFALWIGLEEFYPRLDRLLGTLGLASVATAEDAAAASWNPPAYFGACTLLPGKPNPIVTVSRPSTSLNVAVIGTEPPARTMTGCVPYCSASTRSAATCRGLSRGIR